MKRSMRITLDGTVKRIYNFEFKVQYSQIPLYGLPLRTSPCYYGQFAVSIGKESRYIFYKFNPLNTDTSLLQTVCLVPGERKLLHFL